MKKQNKKPLLSKKVENFQLSPLAKLFQKSRCYPAHQLISLGIGEPYQNSEEGTKLAGIQAIIENNTKYTPSSGTKKLKTAIKEYLLREEALLWPEEGISISSGAKPLLTASLLAILDPGDKVIILSPYYPPFKEAVKLLGGNPVLVDTSADGWQLNIQKLEPLIKKEKPKAVIINSPNNPTGAVYREKEIISLVQLSFSSGFWIISDETYKDFVFEHRFSSPLYYCYALNRDDFLNHNLIIIRSFSKSYAMTGWRVGYSLSPPSFSEKMNIVLENCFGAASSISQEAACATLENSQMPRNIREELALSREIVCKWLKEKGITFLEPEGAFYVFPDFSPLVKRLNLQGAELAEWLLEKVGVVITPGTAFGNYFHHFRLSFALPPEKLKRGLERIEKLLK